MPRRPQTLKRLLSVLRRHHGSLAMPPARGAFELVVWEKVAYLTTDARRGAAFELLRRTVGLTPDSILAAKRATIVDVLKTGGIGAPERATNLIAAAELVIGDFDGRLDDICARPLREAKRALKQVHGIGDPGAEKILLYTRRHPVLGLDSNGLRVLTRLGYGVQTKSYTATYKSATDEALAELGDDIDRLIEANLLLRHHGQTLCKTSSPKCGACVLRADCPSARAI